MWLVAVTLAIGATHARAQGQSVCVLRIDGSSVTGSWIGVRSGGILAVDAGAGAVEIPLSDVQRISFLRASGADPAADPPSTPASARDETGGAVILHLVGGGRLMARNLRGTDDGVTVDSLLGPGTTITLERLAGVELTTDPLYVKAREQFADALRHRRPAEDVLVTRDAPEPKVLRGRIERLGDAEVSFVFGGRSRTAQLERLYGIVLATGGADTPVYPALVQLADRSVIAGRIEEADDTTLRLEASIGSIVTLDMALIRGITLRSDRVTFLSDLPIASERVDGVLHRPWPVRTNRNLRGGPISIGTRRFERGIACHSRTELTYTLDDRYALFAATIGLDNTVRPRGSVVFRVLGDGVTLFDSGLVTGSDEPRDMLVELSGVGELSLVVDYGEGLDLSDHADWGGARLIRPAKNETGVQ